MKQIQSQNRNHTAVVCLLGAACVVAFLVLIAVVRTSTQKQTTIGEFTPPPFESAAAFGVPEVEDDLGWSELSVRPGYVAHVCGALRADADGSVAVWFSSDKDNEVWLKLRLKNAQGETLGETGILKPGEYVERMKLEDKAQSGPVVLQIMGYEPETYYSAGSVSLETNLTVAD